MKKKNGFTLAEVLITLAIIGVVATLTLPALMSNTAEQQAVTALRKSVNTLSEVAQMSAAVDGFDYSGLNETMTPGTADTIDANGVVKQSLWAMLSSKANVDRKMSGTSKITGTGGCSTNTSQIFFTDGTVLCYTDVATGDKGADEAIIKGYIDTNGVKGPNLNFTCSSVECKPNERKYGDEFPITLKGAVVYPGHVKFTANKVEDDGTEAENNAARWAMRK